MRAFLKTEFHSKRMWFFWHLFVVILGLNSCAQANLDSAVLSRLEGLSELSTASIISVIAIDDSGKDDEFIGTSYYDGSKIEWNRSVRSKLRELSREPGIQLIARTYQPASTGLFSFYEAPIFDLDVIEFNESSTAAWLVVKRAYQLSNARPNFSRSDWVEILYALEVAMQGGASYQSFAGVWAEFRNTESATFKSVQRVISKHISPQFFGGDKIDNYPPIPAYSNMGLIKNLATQRLGFKEQETFVVKALFFDPAHPATVLPPSGWEHRKPSGQILPYDSRSEFSIPFGANDAGQHQVTGYYGSGADQFEFSYVIDVTDVSQSPHWTPIPSQTIIANHLMSIDLSSYVTDPDGEDLILSLVTTITGLTLTDHTLEWNPVQAPAELSQVGQHTIRMQAQDPRGKISTVNLIVNVAADSLPTVTPGTLPWLVVEKAGSANDKSIYIVDADGDKYTVAFTDGVTTSVTNQTATRTDFTLSYDPPYSEVLNTATKAKTITLTVAYDPTQTPGLRALSWNTSISSTITNVDDPPVWISNPPAQTLTENSAFSITSLGAVNDATIGSSALTLSIQDSSCAWLLPAMLTKVGATWTLAGTPAYVSTATCTFKVRATDTRGLYTDSATVTYTVNDVNRIPTQNNALATYNIDEGAAWELDLSTLFNDPDLSPADPRECTTYTCSAGDCSLGSIAQNKLTWTPDYNASGTYNFTISYKDKGADASCAGANADGVLVTRNVQAIVAHKEGPPEIAIASGTLSYDGTTLRSLAYENIAAGSLQINISQYLDDNYTYVLSATCATCSPGLISVGSPNTGSGSSTLFLDIGTPSYTDGNNSSQLYRDHTVQLTAQKQGSATVAATKTFTLRVNNTNRAPTALLINSNTSSTQYTVTLDGSQSGSAFLNLDVDDADGSADTYTYGFAASSAVIGGVAGKLWIFDPVQAGCARSRAGDSTHTAEVNFALKVSDGKGGTLERSVKLRVINAKVGAGASCPY